MDDDLSMEEIRYDLDKPRITPYTNTWRPHQNTVYCAIKSPLRRKDCNFIKDDHTQSFSTTHCLRFVLGKRYAWRRRRSHTTNFISFQGCLVLYWSRIRKVDNRINLIKKQENPQTTKAYREVTRKPAAATSTFEYQAQLVLQSNSRTRIAKKRSKNWFSNSRITGTRGFCCRTWIRPKRLIRSAKGPRSWSLTWVMPRSSSFARNNAQIVISIKKLALCTVHVGDV